MKLRRQSQRGTIGDILPEVCFAGPNGVTCAHGNREFIRSVVELLPPAHGKISVPAEARWALIHPHTNSPVGGDQLATLLESGQPLLALAPMQEVTDAAFWELVQQRGGADVYWTEYCRVHAVSCLEKWIVASVRANPTGRPVVAQMIGNDIPHLVRTARQLEQLPVAAIDFNLGCPAPVVYKKCAGGGLLRDPQRVDAILGALRETVRIKFTVKTVSASNPQRTSPRSCRSLRGIP